MTFKYASTNRCPTCKHPVAAGAGHEPPNGYHRWCGPMTMAEAMDRESDPSTDEGYGPRAVND